MDTSRRAFGAALASAASYGRILGANSRPSIGVIGSGGRGQYLMRTARRAMDVEVRAVCDVYDVRRDQAAQAAGGQPKKYADYQQVLAHNDIDAVIVATPDHWHGPITVDACKAGKDVYVEKPMVHTPRDGQAVVKAAREHKRIIQVGTQGRGMTQHVDGLEKYVRAGALGKVGMAQTWYMSNRGYILKPPANMATQPSGLDWQTWLGRGPKIPWNPDVYFSPYKWLHYDGGMIMGIGIHVVDTAHYLLGLRNPVAAVAGGGTYFYKDGRDTPDTVSLILDYPEETTVTFSAECLSAPGVKTSAGVELRGTGGKLWLERYSAKECLRYTPNPEFSKTPAAIADGTDASAEPMLRNWIDCIQSRKKTIANEVVAYYSTVACYMGLEAFRTKSRIVWKSQWDLPA